jgi:hypothetical protein
LLYDECDLLCELSCGGNYECLGVHR